MHATVVPPAAGIVNVGGEIVYVYTHGYVLPSQSVYVNVQVFDPEQTGSAPGTPADTVSVLLQLSITEGGTGTVASAIQATVEDPPTGIVTIGGLMVYV